MLNDSVITAMWIEEDQRLQGWATDPHAMLLFWSVLACRHDVSHSSCGHMYICININDWKRKKRASLEATALVAHPITKNAIKGIACIGWHCCFHNSCQIIPHDARGLASISYICIALLVSNASDRNHVRNALMALPPARDSTHQTTWRQNMKYSTMSYWIWQYDDIKSSLNIVFCFLPKRKPKNRSACVCVF